MAKAIGWACLAPFHGHQTTDRLRIDRSGRQSVHAFRRESQQLALGKRLDRSMHQIPGVVARPDVNYHWRHNLSGKKNAVYPSRHLTICYIGIKATEMGRGNRPAGVSVTIDLPKSVALWR